MNNKLEIFDMPRISHFKTNSGTKVGLDQIENISLLNNSGKIKFVMKNGNHYKHLNPILYNKYGGKGKSIPKRKKIKNNICKIFNLQNNALDIVTRKEEIVFPRYISYYMLWRLCKYSIEKIAKYYPTYNGNVRDRTSIYYGLNKINNAMEGYDGELKSKLQLVLNYYNLEFISYIRK